MAILQYTLELISQCYRSLEEKIEEKWFNPARCAAFSAAQKWCLVAEPLLYAVNVSSAVFEEDYLPISKSYS